MKNKLVSATGNKVEISKMDKRTVRYIVNIVQALLNEGIIHNDMEAFKCAYDYLGLHGNKRIMGMYKRNTKIGITIKQNILEDITAVITEEIENHNDGLLELLIKHYMKRYPSVESNLKKYDSWHGYMGCYLGKERSKCLFADLYYAVYSRPSAGDFIRYATFPEDYKIQDDIQNAKHVLGGLLETDLDNSILYQRFLKKKKEEVCDYLKIDADKFEDYILKLIFDKGIATGNDERICSLIQKMHTWIWEGHTNTKFFVRENDDTLKQAVSRVFESACIGLVLDRVQKCGIEGIKVEMSQINNLARIKDMDAFFCIFFSAVVFELYTEKVESEVNKCYEDFSFDSIYREKELLMRIDALKRQHKQKTDKMQSELDGQLVRLNRLEAESRQKIEEQTAGYKKEISGLKKQLNDLEHSREDDKTQVQSRNEFIKMLSASEDDAVMDDIKIDMQKLKSKRYLFVGSVNEAMPYLKKDFPKSVFINNENYNLKKIKADRAVVFTNYISHEMFYKIKNGLKDVPVIWCNSKNKDVVYRKMQKAV